MATGSDAPIGPLQVIVDTKPVGWRTASRSNVALLEATGGVVGFVAGDAVGVAIGAVVGNAWVLDTWVLDTADEGVGADGEPDEPVPALDPHAVVSRTIAIATVEERVAIIAFMQVRRSRSLGGYPLPAIPLSERSAYNAPSGFPLWLSVKRAPVAQRTERVASDQKPRCAVAQARDLERKVPSYPLSGSCVGLGPGAGVAQLGGRPKGWG
jgi:hypothetical protein